MIERNKYAWNVAVKKNENEDQVIEGTVHVGNMSPKNLAVSM